MCPTTVPGFCQGWIFVCQSCTNQEKQFCSHSYISHVIESVCVKFEVKFRLKKNLYDHE